LSAHRDAWAWGQDYLRRTNDELWQVVWLDNPAARPRLLTPAQGKAASDQVFAALGLRP